ncbi:MAG: hypothetical protein ACLSXO_00305 [Coprococcus sp.]
MKKKTIILSDHFDAAHFSLSSNGTQTTELSTTCAGECYLSGAYRGTDTVCSQLYQKNGTKFLGQLQSHLAVIQRDCRDCDSVRGEELGMENMIR